MGQRSLTDTPPKKDIQIESEHMKGCSTPYIIKEIRIKTTNEILLHTYQNGQNSEHWQHQMLATTCSKRNTHSLLVEMQNDTNVLEDSFMVSCKTNHILTIQFSTCAPWHLHNETESFYLHKNLHMDIRAVLFISAGTWK